MGKRLLLGLYTGTFLHSKFGSGQRPHGGQGGHFAVFGQSVIDTSGHFGHTGGTILDFNI
jgi:hypothetical protein